MAMRIYDASEGGDPSLYIDDATGQFYRMTDAGLVAEGGTTWQSQAKPLYDAGWTDVHGNNQLIANQEGGGPPQGSINRADTDAYRMMSGQLWAKTPAEFGAPIPTGYDGLPRRSYADWLAELERARKSDAQTNMIEGLVAAGLPMFTVASIAAAAAGAAGAGGAAPTSTGFSGTFNPQLPAQSQSVAQAAGQSAGSAASGVPGNLDLIQGPARFSGSFNPTPTGPKPWSLDLIKGDPRFSGTFDPALPGSGTFDPALPGSGTTLPQTPPTPPTKDRDTLLDAAKLAAGGLSALAGTQSTVGTDGSGTTDALLAEEEERQRRIQEATDAVNRAFAGFDDSYYGGIADSYLNFQKPLFDEQVAEARRRLPMTVPHTQSSAYQRKAGNLETDIGRNEANLKRDAIAEANRRRGEVDFERGQLINLATGGADVASVAQEAATRANTLAAPAQFTPIADLFGKYAADAGAYAMMKKPVAAAQPSRPLLFSGSGSRSVRNIA